MSEKKGKVLVVDDNEDVLLSLNMLLRQHVEGVRILTDPKDIGRLMDTFDPDVILLDMNFHRNASSGEEGYQWLDFILRKNPKAVVLFITAYVDTEKAVRAIKAGAVDFIPKPWDNAKLLGIVESAIRLSLTRRNSSFENEKREIYTQPKTEDAPVLIGESPQMQLLNKQIAKIAATDANVLITGENGSGKDVVAHLLHYHSHRNNKPFISIDLGTIPEHLFESELFGHEKGAFTDAKGAKAGRLESAAGGTAFLDEIGNLLPGAQQKLLTMIEKREISRLGSTKVNKVDVRILSATNADLASMVAEGTFRQDLLYRLNTIELHIPPLRERGEDIVLLAEYFSRQIAQRYRLEDVKISTSAKRKLLSHSWPGNVRELQHVVERAIVMASENVLEADDFEFSRMIEPASKPETLNLEALEQDAIMKAISRSNGNLSQAASLLGITRFTLYRKIEKYGL
ncbi:MAG: sigma-54 dependent transcriptional regulator [Muribaculaceae bacterium]|nr:sigma-54 dependent transcriptional regulator [Muribaculaceae bacterium]